MTKENYAQAGADPYEALTGIVADVVRVNAERNDQESRFPRENLDALAAAGWTGVLNDPKYGGLGLTYQAFAEAAYRIGQADASTGLIYVMHVGAPRPSIFTVTKTRRSAG
jgi:alkylation response protein AidB-like acyl-CoA dehydrogenase